MIFYEIMINSKQALTSLERYSAIMRNPASRTCFLRLMGYYFIKICNSVWSVVVIDGNQENSR